MKIVADENIPALADFFGALGSVHTCPGRTLSADDVRGADVLLVRSVTRVDARLLANSRVRFVGTATIGTDHIDTQWLDAQGIAWAAAPGCNAAAVVDYVLGVMAFAAKADGCALRDYSVGIVGAGNVGGRLRTRLEALGLDVMVSDPPRQAQGAAGPFSPLEAVLAQDVVCLHTPLTHDGPHPTYHLLDQHRLSGLGSHQILINAGRGAVVDNRALLRRLGEPDPPRAVLDVWENEPTIDAELFDSVLLGTPHIAGYSLEGKLRGTAMLSDAFRRFQGLEKGPVLEQILPDPCCLQLPAEASDDADRALAEIIRAAYDPSIDSRALADVLKMEGEGDRAKGFDQLRRDYPVRREFFFTAPEAPPNTEAAALLAAAGFRAGS